MFLFIQSAINDIFPPPAGDAILRLQTQNMRIVWILLASFFMIGLIAQFTGMLANTKVDILQVVRRLFFITVMLAGYNFMFFTIVNLGVQAGAYLENVTAQDTDRLRNNAVSSGPWRAVLSGTPTPTPGATPSASPGATPGPSPGGTPGPSPTPGPPSGTEAFFLNSVIQYLNTSPTQWGFGLILSAIAGALYLLVTSLMYFIWKTALIALFVLGPYILLFCILPNMGTKIFQNLVGTFIQLCLWPVWWGVAGFLFWLGWNLVGVNLGVFSAVPDTTANPGGLTGVVSGLGGDSGNVSNALGSALFSLVGMLFFLCTPKVVAAVLPWGGGGALASSISGAASSLTLGMVSAKYLGDTGPSGGGGGKSESGGGDAKKSGHGGGDFKRSSK